MIRIRIRVGLAPWIRIRILDKSWIRIRIKTYADPQHRAKVQRFLPGSPYDSLGYLFVESGMRLAQLFYIDEDHLLLRLLQTCQLSALLNKQLYDINVSKRNSIKQCWITYIKRKNQKNPPLEYSSSTCSPFWKFSFPLGKCSPAMSLLWVRRVIRGVQGGNSCPLSHPLNQQDSKKSL